MNVGADGRTKYHARGRVRRIRAHELDARDSRHVDHRSCVRVCFRPPLLFSRFFGLSCVKLSQKRRFLQGMNTLLINFARKLRSLLVK